MTGRVLLCTLSAAALLAPLPALDAASVPKPVFDAATEQLSANPLLAEWIAPIGVVPVFDKTALALLKPALEAGMAAHLAEIDAIANNPAKPTFAISIEGMERAGEQLDRAQTCLDPRS